MPKLIKTIENVSRYLALVALSILLTSFSFPQAIASGGAHTLVGPVSVIWEARYDGTVAGRGDRAQAITVDVGGNVYVTGAAYYQHGENYNADYTTIRYDSQGNELWVATYNGPANGDDYPRDVDADAEGNVYVTGHSWGGYLTEGGTRSDSVTIKYDGSTGQELWVARYDAARGTDAAQAITVDTGGNVYVVGYSYFLHTTNYDFTTIKYDSNGNQLWAVHYNGPAYGHEFASAIDVSTTGNVYVTGHTLVERASGPCGGSNTDYATIKYSPDGIEQWVVLYGGPANVQDTAYALKLDGMENVFVTGESYNVDSSCRGDAPADYATIKYNPNGNGLWVRRHSRGTNTINHARDLAVDEEGSAYVTGWSGIYNREDWGTVKYGSQGEKLWERYYNGPGDGRDGAGAIVLNGTSVYVTGWSWGSDSAEDYTTVRYRRDGNEVWVARYNGPANSNDYAIDVAVSGDGKIYVTGEATDFYPNDAGYTTIKYGNWLATELEYKGDQSALKGSQANLSARLTESATGLGIPGKKMDFLITDRVNSLSAEAISDTTGDASVAVTIDLPIGLYTVTASFSGDREFLPATSPPLDFAVYEPTEGMSTFGGGIIKDNGPGVKNFGFSVRYLKNQGIPTGNLRFRDSQAKVYVASSEIEWLVVSGDKARFSGACIVNGEPCTFVVSVTAGGPGIGSFSINLSTGYSAFGIITGGNIVTREGN